jgi:hypothetical protein
MGLWMKLASRRPRELTQRGSVRFQAHLQGMALFAVNTGLRDSNVCGLQ